MTRLQKAQWAFLQDESRFIQFIVDSNYTAIGGERQRSKEVQDQKYKDGFSKAKGGESQHQKCMADDYEFFDEKGKWLEVPPKIKVVNGRDKNDHEAILIHKAKLQPFGDHWESLDPKNKWGGNFYHGGDYDLYDPGHCERRD